MEQIRAILLHFEKVTFESHNTTSFSHSHILHILQSTSQKANCNRLQFSKYFLPIYHALIFIRTFSQSLSLYISIHLEFYSSIVLFFLQFIFLFYNWI